MPQIKPSVRTPPMLYLTVFSHPLSPISAATLRRARRRRVRLNSIPSLRYRHPLFGGGRTLRSTLRVCGKRGCQSKPAVRLCRRVTMQCSGPFGGEHATQCRCGAASPATATNDFLAENVLRGLAAGKSRAALTSAFGGILGGTCRWLVSVANDPTETSTSIACCTSACGIWL